MAKKTITKSKRTAKPAKKETAATALRVRHSVRELEQMYEAGNKKPLEDLMRAWKGIKALPPEDVNSFFNIGGYHGEPFIGSGAISPKYWGGYCNHGNVLFPTWHRIYVLKIEEALQKIEPDVMMPYWDETSSESLNEGIPWSLTVEKFELDGEMIDNPLRSFKMPIDVRDDVTGQNQIYAKPAGYETVRYPLSGLVGTVADRRKTEAHNAKYPNYEENTKLLNQNVVAWLKGGNVSPSHPDPTKGGIYWQYVQCLKAPNYTAFSNTTSAAAWNKENKTDGITVPLEAPHNDIHLSVGGFDVPGQGEFGQIAGANGDMGENNTAGLDPIFFFHHCNVDRMFWLWQKQTGHTESFDIIDGFKGTSSSDSQGPTPNLPFGAPLNMETPLNPFLFNPDTDQRVYTSNDCVNIETQLGFTYSEGSLEKKAAPVKSLRALPKSAVGSKRKLLVSGIDRALFAGSFVVMAYAKVKGEEKEYFLGANSVLSRWNVVHCANCQTHLEVESYFDLSDLTDEEIEDATFRVEVKHRMDGFPKRFNYTVEVI